MMIGAIKSPILLIHHQLYSSLRVISAVIILIIWYFQVDLHNQDKRTLGTDIKSLILSVSNKISTEFDPDSLLLPPTRPGTDRYVECGSLGWKNQFRRIRENLTPSVNQKTFKGLSVYVDSCLSTYLVGQIMTKSGLQYICGLQDYDL